MVLLWNIADYHNTATIHQNCTLEDVLPEYKFNLEVEGLLEAFSESVSTSLPAICLI